MRTHELSAISWHVVPVLALNSTAHWYAITSRNSTEHGEVDRSSRANRSTRGFLSSGLIPNSIFLRRRYATMLSRLLSSTFDLLGFVLRLLRPVQVPSGTESRECASSPELLKSKLHASSAAPFGVMAPRLQAGRAHRVDFSIKSDSSQLSRTCCLWPIFP